MNEENQENKKPGEAKKKTFFLRHLFDFALIALLAGGTATFYIAKAISNANYAKHQTDLTATISFHRQIIKEIDLGKIEAYEEFVIEGEFTPLTVAVDHNAICVKESGCPGQECVHEHWVKEPNRVIICAYNYIYINVTAASWSDVVIG